MNLYIEQLNNFQNKLISHINILKSLFQKEYKLRYDILNNILKKEYSYIDIQNAKNLLDISSYVNINNKINNFCKSKDFISQYYSLRDTFEELIEKGKYIENKYLSSIINKYKLNLIPINKNYYIYLNNYNIEIIEELSKKNSYKFEYKTLFKIKYEQTIQKIILKNNNNIEKELSFFFIIDFYRKELMEIKIKNIIENKKENKDYIIQKVNFNDYNKELDNFFIVSDNKYIIIDAYGTIYLYDNLFQKKSIIDKEYTKIDDFINLDEFNFVYTIIKGENMFKIKINNNNELIEKLQIRKGGINLINYFKKEKILFSKDDKYIYLINFNISFPEVIQKIEINGLEGFYLDRTFSLFPDEFIYIIEIQKSYENKDFYFIEYLVQYKIIEKELKEISILEINRRKA